MFYGGISGPQAAVLSIAKLAATTAVYAWGGAGGIFAPTLFFGAAIGLAFTDLCGLVLHLQPSDRIALTVAGMSACLGAVVRAPITSILIVFEMTHHKIRESAGGAPTISLQLSGVDAEQILAQAESVDNPGNRIRKLKDLIFEQIGAAGHDELFFRHKFRWKGTDRECDVVFS